MKKSIRLGHININHLLNKVTDLHVFLQKAKPLFDIFGVTESRLTANKAIPDQWIDIPGYHVHRRDTGKRGETGVAVYVRNCLVDNVVRRKDLEVVNVECMWLEVKLAPNTTPILVSFLYRNPSETAEWFDQFVNMYDKLFCKRNHCDVMFLGDFNIDMIKPQPTWNSITASLGLTQLMKQPSRVTANTATLLDHIYSTNPSSITETSQPDLSISDHNVISCISHVCCPKSGPKRHTEILFRSFKSFNKNMFLADLSVAPFHLVYNYTDPNDALSVWYNIFLPIIDKHAPLRRKRVKHPKLPPWLEKDIVIAMAERDKLKQEKQFEEYKKLKNRIKNMITKAKERYFEKLIEHQKDTSTLWRALNTFTKGSTVSSNNIPNTLTAEMFNDYFISVSQNLKSDPNMDPHDNDLLKDFCQRALGNKDPFVIPFISVYKVGKLINSMDNKKSTGPDGINNQLLKVSVPYIVESLTYIFNQCIAKNIFPTELKRAKVIPLQKVKHDNTLSNFRLISLLSSLSKIIERHVHSHLTLYLESHNLFHPKQSGFRRFHSCSTALASLTNTWLTALNAAEMVGVVYLDFKKAFDMVDHDILLNKMSMYTNNSKSIPFFRSYLTCRSQHVSVHGTLSSEKSILSGVPQGSVQGPILFCLFISDLPLHLTSTKCDMLADDTTLHKTSKNIVTLRSTLQNSLDTVFKWCGNNRMVLNPIKTKSMVISTRQKHQLAPLLLDLSVGRNSIEQVHSHRLLGIIIDDKLCWDSHVHRTTMTVARNVYLLSKLCKIVDTQTLKLFYNAHIKSHVDYASVVWDGCSDAIRKRLASLIRRCVKLILPSPTLSMEEKFKDLKILNLQQQFLYNKGVFVFKSGSGTMPEYITSLFTRPMSSQCSSRISIYHLPHPRLDLFKTSVSFSGATLWNNLPQSLKSCQTLPVFKRKYFDYLLEGIT